MPWMACVDCDRMQEFIFHSPRLRHVRNASALLCEHDKEAQELARSLGATSVAGAGGITWAVFEQRAAALEFIRRARRKYAKIGVSATGCLRQVTYVPGSREMRELYRELRRLKDGPVAPNVHISAPPLKECVVRGFGAATTEIELPGGERNYASPEGERINRGVGGGPEFPELVRAIAETPVGELCGGFMWPEDIEEMIAGLSPETARAEEAEGKLLGLLYADANDMGERLREFGGTIDQYAEVANAVHKAVVDATAAALAAALNGAMRCRMKQGRRVYPFLPLIIGGDDVVIACPAEHALYLALELCRAFQNLTRNGPASEWLNCSEGIGLGVGVAINHRGFPLSESFRMAKQLQASAKMRSRAVRRATHQPREVSCVDFAVHYGSYLGNVWELRQAVRDRNGYRRVTAKPYEIWADGSGTPGNGWWTLDCLLQATEKAVRDGPGQGFWKELRELLTEEKTRAEARLADMLRIEENNAKYSAVLQLLGIDSADDGRLPVVERPEDYWAESGTVFVTPLADLAEIWTLVKRRLEEEEASCA